MRRRRKHVQVFTKNDSESGGDTTIGMLFVYKLLLSTSWSFRQKHVLIRARSYKITHAFLSSFPVHCC